MPRRRLFEAVRLRIDGAVPREAAKAGREAPVNATLTALVRERETSWGARTATGPPAQTGS